MLKKNLITYANTLHLDALGIVTYPLQIDSLAHLEHEKVCPFTHQELEERLHGNTTLEQPTSLIVVLFPYYVPFQGTSNISRYTWGKDYHLVVKDYLTRLGTWLEENATEEEYIGHSVEWEVHVDTSPFADRYLAYLAGLGFYGKNHCFIHPHYGSYVAIGSLLTNLKLKEDKPNLSHCIGCETCYLTCPGQALSSIDANGFHYERCKSYLTQKKGELEPWEIRIMEKTPLLFGCDVCQEVCPHNKDIPTTPIPEFLSIEPNLDTSNFSSMTNKEFKTAYGDRAFSWRGKSILLRNKELIKKENP